MCRVRLACSKQRQSSNEPTTTLYKQRLHILAFSAAVVAQQVEVVAIQLAPPLSGQLLFQEYCAVCHGSDAKGDGPVADALKKRPPDLTQVAGKNNGTYPELHVMNFITGQEVSAPHGSRGMPVFRSPYPNTRAIFNARVKNVADYVGTLQAH